MLAAILVVLLVLVLLGGFGYRSGWGPEYLGGGLVVTVLVIILILYLLGRI